MRKQTGKPKCDISSMKVWTGPKRFTKGIPTKNRQTPQNRSPNASQARANGHSTAQHCAQWVFRGRNPLKQAEKASHEKAVANPFWSTSTASSVFPPDTGRVDGTVWAMRDPF